ncbi:kinase-like domain-containing protein [Phialemonium atrogriseum]|uniref:Kinase-like domain-containing protein n=1 Tax=Phialemonium atrogriseum TaxID=1093897 RepID=A0AAJ0FMY9_9PEZI|nr:kinase-like domain-containing protein [Phialemonium atrogriseum]KAK1768748.1 kinase-like domain-containing protein [Phialemonium atrogriseum]
MSINQPSVLQQQQLSERSCGTVVRKELIHRFSERVIRCDGVKDALAPDFADGFLNRHPDLAKTLVAAPQPSHNRPKAEKATRVGAFDRLKEMMRQDRRQALFGDSPPPPRQPAAYPEGEIIYHCNNRYVVRHGDAITKYTTCSDGMGANDHPNEALALRFVKAHTTIPVPEVVSSDWDRITMEYVEGQTLQQAWPVLTPDQRSDIMAQLSGYIAQMRSLGGIHLGRLDGQGVVVPSIMTRSGGPFGTLTEFHDWLVQPPHRLQAQSMYWHQITTQLGAEYPIVFTHADIAARNIMVRDGRIVALLDWEFAGWYPEYWEYVFALRGMDNIDWETLGRHLPSLFAKRYDLEYILVGFIVRLS